MRIGELARRTGTTPKAIRLYEGRGLLGTVARDGSYRQYGEADVAQVQLIRQAQALGFRLSELDGLDQMHTAEGGDRMGQRVAARRVAVAQELLRLQALDAELAQLQAQLHACDGMAVPATAQACAVAAPVPPAARDARQFTAPVARGAPHRAPA